MNISICLGIVLGAIVGGAFAWLQMLALHRDELLERKERVPALLRHVPDSMSRLVLLLVALVLVQVLFPTASLIWISAGFFVFFLIPTLRRLKDRRRESFRRSPGSDPFHA